MGFAVVDFFVRECRAVVGGDLVIVRVGSCGSVNQELSIGTVAVPPASVGISRNYDHFHPSTYTGETGCALKAYQVTKPISADEDVHAALVKALESTRPPSSADRFAGQNPKIHDSGLNGSADSFYGSQGRTDSQFVDDNQGLIPAIQEEHPTLSTLEMETYVLHHLALCANYAVASKERVDALQEGSLPRIKTAAMQMMCVSPLVFKMRMSKLTQFPALPTATIEASLPLTRCRRWRSGAGRQFARLSLLFRSRRDASKRHRGASGPSSPRLKAGAVHRRFPMWLHTILHTSHR